MCKPGQPCRPRVSIRVVPKYELFWEEHSGKVKVILLLIAALTVITLLSIDDHVPERRGTTEVEHGHETK